MTPRIERHARVWDELLEIHQWLAQDNVDIADRFLLAAEETFQTLAQRPHMGRRRELGNPRLAELRWWRVRGFKSCVIFYLPLERGVHILHVLHAARDIDRVLEDESP